MPTPMEVVKAFEKAFREKDAVAYRNLLHPNYEGRCPMGTVSNRDQAVEAMQACPLTFYRENSVYVAEGNTVVHIFDWIVEAPFQAKTRVVQHLTIENGQIRSLEMIMDTAIFPKEFVEQMEKMTKEKASV